MDSVIGDEKPPRHQTDDDLTRGRANPLFTLGLDHPYGGMHRVTFDNGDVLALHVRARQRHAQRRGR